MLCPYSLLDLQGSDDNRRRDQSLGASQNDCQAEREQLPPGGSPRQTATAKETPAAEEKSAKIQLGCLVVAEQELNPKRTSLSGIADFFWVSGTRNACSRSRPQAQSLYIQLTARQAELSQIDLL